MGLIKAGLGAVGGVLADQWKEFFYCEALPENVLVTKGEKVVNGKRSSNTKGSDNIITNGSKIAVNEGQFMIIVDQGEIVEFSGEAGEFIYDTSTEPSLFTGSFGSALKETFKTIGRRFAMGGDIGHDQRIYFFNTKEIIGNKFGTPNPIMFDVVNREINMRRTVQVRCNGVYSYTITNPLLFYSKVCGNVEDVYTRDRIDQQLKTEFIDALQPALASLSELGLRPAQIPAKATELKAAMNEALKLEWVDSRGITVEKIALNPITLTEEDMKKINEMEDAATYGSNAFMMAGRMTEATATAMEKAASNEAGALNGFIGMNMAGNAMGGGFNQAQNFFNMGVQQQQQKAAQEAQAAQEAKAANAWTCSCGATATGKFCPECGNPKPSADAWTCSCGTTATGKFCPECGKAKPADDSWTCSCGTVNKSKFCSECGNPKPAAKKQYKCNKCGWEPDDPTEPPKFCAECGDPFNEADAQ